MQLSDLEEMEILGILKKAYGYDFFEYVKTARKRRIEGFLNKRQLNNADELSMRLEKSDILIEDFLSEFLVPTTELFRDPYFFVSFRKNIIPYLQMSDSFKIWHAGCSTGEEVFSMSILLYEENLIDRALLYGTDINIRSLEQAKKGIIDSALISKFSKNYFSAQGATSLRSHWLVEYDYAMLKTELMKKIVFAEHNLISDHGFGVMDVICIRNVLIYFNISLKNQILQMLTENLKTLGFLCLGTKESLVGTSVEKSYELIDSKARIYRKLLKAK